MNKILYIIVGVVGLTISAPIPNPTETFIGDDQSIKMLYGGIALLSIGALLGACVCCRRRKSGFEPNQLKDRKEFENESGLNVSVHQRTEYPILSAISTPPQHISSNNNNSSGNSSSKNNNESAITIDSDSGLPPSSPLHSDLSSPPLPEVTNALATNIMTIPNNIQNNLTNQLNVVDNIQENIICELKSYQIDNEPMVMMMRTMTDSSTSDGINHLQHLQQHNYIRPDLILSTEVTKLTKQLSSDPENFPSPTATSVQTNEIINPFLSDQPINIDDVKLNIDYNEIPTTCLMNNYTFIAPNNNNSIQDINIDDNHPTTINNLLSPEKKEVEEALRVLDFAICGEDTIKLDEDDDENNLYDDTDIDLFNCNKNSNQKELNLLNYPEGDQIEDVLRKILINNNLNMENNQDDSIMNNTNYINSNNLENNRKLNDKDISVDVVAEEAKLLINHIITECQSIVNKNLNQSNVDSENKSNFNNTETISLTSVPNQTNTINQYDSYDSSKSMNNITIIDLHKKDNQSPETPTETQDPFNIPKPLEQFKLNQTFSNSMEDLFSPNFNEIECSTPFISKKVVNLTNENLKLQRNCLFNEDEININKYDEDQKLDDDEQQQRVNNNTFSLDDEKLPSPVINTTFTTIPDQPEIDINSTFRMKELLNDTFTKSLSNDVNPNLTKIISTDNVNPIDSIQNYLPPSIKIDKDEEVTSEDLTTVTPVNTPIELNYSNDSWDTFISKQQQQQQQTEKPLIINNNEYDTNQPSTSSGYSGGGGGGGGSSSGWFLHPQYLNNQNPNENKTFDIDDEDDYDDDEDIINSDDENALGLTFDALRKQLAEALPHAQGICNGSSNNQYSDGNNSDNNYDDGDTDEENEINQRTFDEYRSPLFMSEILDGAATNEPIPQSEMIINYKRTLSPILEESEEETCKTFILNETKNLDSTSTGCVETGEAIMGVTKTLMASNDTLFNFEDTLGDRDDGFSPRSISRTDSGNNNIECRTPTNDVDSDDIGQQQQEQQQLKQQSQPRNFKPMEFNNETNENIVNDVLSPDQQKTFSEELITVEHVSSDLSNGIDTTFTTNTLDEKTCISIQHNIKHDNDIDNDNDNNDGGDGGGGGGVSINHKDNIDNVSDDDDLDDIEERISEISEPTWNSTTTASSFNVNNNLNDLCEVNSLNDVPSIYDGGIDVNCLENIDVSTDIINKLDKTLSAITTDNESQSYNLMDNFDKTCDKEVIDGETKDDDNNADDEEDIDLSDKDSLINNNNNFKNNDNDNNDNNRSLLTDSTNNYTKNNLHKIENFLSNERDFASSQQCLNNNLMDKTTSSYDTNKSQYQQNHQETMTINDFKENINHSARETYKTLQDDILIEHNFLSDDIDDEDKSIDDMNYVEHHDARYIRPCTDIMSTSFNEWDSDVDDSNSSEEFMYFKGTSVPPTPPPPPPLPTNPNPDYYKNRFENNNNNNNNNNNEIIISKIDKNNTSPVLDKETNCNETIWKSHKDQIPLSKCDEDQSEDNNNSDIEDSCSDDEGDCEEWVPSCWDSALQPSRSALKSPDKSSSINKKRRSVAFKKQNYHSVYEYPKEVIQLSPSYSEPQLWANKHFSNLYLDSPSYNSTNNNNNTNNNDMLVDEDDIDGGFNVSSSQRPFHGSQFNAQQCYTWPVDSEFSWSSHMQENSQQHDSNSSDSGTDKYSMFSNYSLDWPTKKLGDFLCSEETKETNDNEFSRPDSGVGESTELLTESISLGDLCHTKSSLRLPLNILSTTITSKQPVNNINNNITNTIADTSANTSANKLVNDISSVTTTSKTDSTSTNTLSTSSNVNDTTIIIPKINTNNLLLSNVDDIDVDVDNNDYDVDDEDADDNNNNDDVDDDDEQNNLLLTTPSCTGSMDSLSSSSTSSAERQVSFSTFGKKSSNNNVLYENNHLNENDLLIKQQHHHQQQHQLQQQQQHQQQHHQQQKQQPSIILIENNDLSMNNDQHIVDIIIQNNNTNNLNNKNNDQTTRQQNDSTDEDSGIESIMRIAKEN